MSNKSYDVTNVTSSYKFYGKRKSLIQRKSQKCYKENPLINNRGELYFDTVYPLNIMSIIPKLQYTVDFVINHSLLNGKIKKKKK